MDLSRKITTGASPCNNDSDDEDDREFFHFLVTERGGNILPIDGNLGSPKREYVESEFGAYDTIDINKELDLEEYLLYEILEKSSLEYAELPPMNTSSFSHVKRNLQDYVVKLDEKIRDNYEAHVNVITQAKGILIEKLYLQRELDALNERMRSRDEKPAENRELEHALKKKGQDVFKNRFSCLRSSCNARFGLPYFKTADRFPAYFNKDMREIVNNNEVMLFKLPRYRKILPIHAQKITTGILSQLKRKRVEQLRTKLNETRGAEDGNQQKSKLLEAINLAESVQDIREAEEWNIPVDFQELDCKLKSRQFTSDDYKRIWSLVGASNLSKKQFSSDELNKLNQLSQQYGCQNWDGIASSLGTRRSGFMCFAQWVRSCKKNSGRVWTEKEDRLLRQLCGNLDRIKDPGALKCHWDYVRRRFPHRTYSQIHAHWKYVLQPSLKKGRFSEEETGKLQRLRNEGKSFREIASIFKSRSCCQLRSHCDQLASRMSFNCGPWSNEEEHKLKELIDKYGTSNWKKISEELGTRSRSQCRSKLITLVKWSEDELKKFNELLKKYGRNFEKISAKLKTKSAGQCHYRYIKSLKTKNHHWTKNESGKSFETPSENRIRRRRRYGWMRRPQEGKDWRWTTPEVGEFTNMIKLYGFEAEKLRTVFKTKSLKQCGILYEKITQNQLTRNESSSQYWSVAEKKSFNYLVRTHGPRIEKICAAMQTKTFIQCCHMYEKMRRKQKSASSSGKKIKKEPREDPRCSVSH